MSKNILYVTRPLSPPWDEASKNFAYNLAKEVAGKHPYLKIHLMTKGILPNLPKNIIQHPIYTSSQNDFGFRQKIKMLWFLIRQAQKFDVVHLLFTPTKTNSLILKYILRLPNSKNSKFANLSAIRIADRFAKKERGKRRRSGKRNKLKVIQTIATLREDLFSPAALRRALFADQLVTYSRYAYQRLQDWGFDNVAHIYPGLDTQHFRPLENRAELRAQYGFQPTDFVINFTGEYIRLDAMDDVINVFIQLARDHSNIKLSLAVRVKNARDAEKKKQVVHRLKKEHLLSRVTFHDDGKYDMAEIYNLADLSLFPVHNMRGKFDVPLAVIEAMACGLPVILSDIPILQEFANEKNSLTIKTGNIEELAQAILSLYNDENKRKYLSTYARTYVKENFSIQKAGKKYAKIYKSL